jgi:4'-phosphopantetheinyl transferase EntD
MAALVPASVAVRESADPSSWRESPWPQERAAVERAVERRRLEHGTVRELARAAMGELGIGPRPLLSGARREPLWPDEVVGSLTHCRGYCAAAVALRVSILTIGIDAEISTPLSDRLIDRVCTASEQQRLPASPTGLGPKTLFSIKEAVFKAWYPMTQRWLGFQDVEVTLTEDGGFAAALQVDAPPNCDMIPGRFEVDGGIIRAVAIIERVRV